MNTSTLFVDAMRITGKGPMEIFTLAYEHICEQEEPDLAYVSRKFTQYTGSRELPAVVTAFCTLIRSGLIEVKPTQLKLNLVA